MKGELAAIATQYAEAILDLAVQADKGGIVEKGNADKLDADLKGVISVFEQTPDLTIVLHHPAVPPERKKEILLRTFEGKVNELTIRLLRLIADRRRLDILFELAERYSHLLRQRKNIVSGKLSSSRELSASQIADLKARLAEHLGKKLELEVEVDRSLLGGAVLRIGDQVVDGSLKGKLAVIEKELMAV